MKTVYTANPYIGEVVVPLVPNKKCHDNMMRSFEGGWTKLPHHSEQDER